MKWYLTILVIMVGLFLGTGQNGCPVGVGYWSNQDEATLTGSSQPLPSAVTHLGASITQINSVILGWQDNSNNEESVRVERKTGVDDAYTEIASVGADITWYRDLVVSPSTTYFYRVRAYNEHGYSMYTNEVSVITHAPPPPPPPPIPPIPYNLSATSTIESQVDLAWKEDYDGLVDFPIQCRVGTDTDWAQIDMLTVECDPEIAIEFSDTDISPTVGTFYYRVSASNISGQSDWSNECWITMPVE